MGSGHLQPSPLEPAFLVDFGEGLWTRINLCGVRPFSDSLAPRQMVGTKAVGMGHWHLIVTPSYCWGGGTPSVTRGTRGAPGGSALGQHFPEQ